MKKEMADIENNHFVSLCRKNYQDLLIVCTIRKYLRNAIEKPTIIDYVQKEFVRLNKHFKDEEMWLFPNLAPTNDLRLQAEQQHEKLRELANDNNLQPEEFADLLEEHIRFEERVLFPLFENIVNEKSNMPDNTRVL
jgi:hemerythrin-like domain-containing protein